jgi:hypothetical protein
MSKRTPLESLLRTPRAVVSLLWFLPIAAAPLEGPSRYFDGGLRVAPEWISAACLVAFLVWLFALYDACIERTASSRRLGTFIFIATAGAHAILWSLAYFLLAWNGQPPRALLMLTSALIAGAGISTFAAIGFAAGAMARAESAIGKEDHWNPFLPLFVLGIGIWFIQNRINDILAQPRITAA